MQFIIKEGFLDEDESLNVVVPEVKNYQGKARLCVNKVGTNWFLLVGNFSEGHQKPARPQDTAIFNGELNKVFNRKRKSLSDYGIGKRFFNMHIDVSQELFDAYSN